MTDANEALQALDKRLEKIQGMIYGQESMAVLLDAEEIAIIRSHLTDPGTENVAEDTYWHIAGLIEPHVDRELRQGGKLPACVTDAVQILLDHWLKTTDPGYVRVPVEPTDEMLADGWEALRNDNGDSCDHLRKAAIAYRAMLAAAQETSHD